MTQSRAIVVVGAGGHAKVVLDLCERASVAVQGIVDPQLAAGASYLGVRVLGGDDVLDDTGKLADSAFVIAIGDGARRRELARKIAAQGRNFATLVHPSAIIGARTAIGAGAVVFAGAVINCDSKIGAHAIVNTGARIDHDCTIGDGVHICPGSVLAGTVTVGEWTMVGAGTVIANNRVVGAHCTIGAGSVVVEDVPDRSLAYGNPCRVRGPAKG